MADDNKIKVSYTLGSEIYDMVGERKVSSSIKLFLNQTGESLLIANAEGHVLFKAYVSESDDCAFIIVEK
jgi:hypothetical protein